jgi:hypothetical protein
MSDASWDEVVEDYKRVQTQEWAEDYVWMEKLISRLLENRDLSRLYPITSHYRLFAFIGTDFKEQYEKPTILIELSGEVREHIKDKFRYKFSLHGIRRRRTCQRIR